MTCWLRETYTLSFTYWEWENCEKWDTRGWKDNAMLVELSECEAPAYMWIHSECKAVRQNSARLISKTLNSN
jgi:hypothetical protein